MHKLKQTILIYAKKIVYKQFFSRNMRREQNKLILLYNTTWLINFMGNLP